MGIIVEALQIFVESFVLGAAVGVLVEFFMQFREVMMEPLMGSAAAQ